jgi:hypothetical protein
MATTKNRTVGALLTTSNADLYTVPANYEANIKAIYVNNSSTSSRTFSLDWYDSQNTTYHTLAEEVTVPANSLLQITDSLWFYKGDKFRGLASAADSVTVTFNVEELFVPNRT